MKDIGYEKIILAGVEKKMVHSQFPARCLLHFTFQVYSFGVNQPCLRIYLLGEMYRMLQKEDGG